MKEIFEKNGIEAEGRVLVLNRNGCAIDVERNLGDLIKENLEQSSYLMNTQSEISMTITIINLEEKTESRAYEELDFDPSVPSWVANIVDQN